MSPTALRAIRSRSGFSASQLARDAGVSISTISQLESGVRNASPELLQRLAVVLKVPIPALLADTDDLGYFRPPMAYLFFDDSPNTQPRWKVRHVDAAGITVTDALSVTARNAAREALAEATTRYSLDPERVEVVPLPPRRKNPRD